MINRDIFFPAFRQLAFGGVMRQPQVEGTSAILDEWDGRMPGGDLRWLAYMLATVVWETAHTMQPVREAYWLSEDWRRKNLRYYPFYGRGYVQLTWEQNYRVMGVELGVDLLGHPDLALDPKIAADIMFTGMTRGMFTGKLLVMYFHDDVAEWAEARAIINGDADVNHNNVPDSIDIGNLAQDIWSCLHSAS